MRKVAYIYHQDYLLHAPEEYHPENPQRLKAVHRAVTESGLVEKMVRITPEKADKEDILLNHSPEYFARVEATAGRGSGHFDPDTYYCKDSFHTAMLAAGGVIQAGKGVIDGKFDSAFCAIRPPGHHAEYDHAKGFCLFNNIAILANWLIEQRNFERIAILDFDGHHGNGTQHSFYHTNKVHFCSIHAYPFYPGTGAAGEIGRGEGQGYTLNFPLSYMANDDDYVGPIRDEWVPAMDDYRPQILLLSAGYDAFEDDPYVNLGVTLEGINQVMRIARNVADRHCDGSIVSIFEGGYDLNFIAEAVIDHIKILLE